MNFETHTAILSYDEIAYKWASSRKHTTMPWHCGFDWVTNLLRRHLRTWDAVEAQESHCLHDGLHNEPFFLQYVEVGGYVIPTS